MDYSNPNMIFIYALIDPFSESIRYIGKSSRPNQRLQNHMNEKSDCRRCEWLQSIKARNGKPKLVILETVELDSDGDAAERKWIKVGREKGWDLTNSTSGGPGVPDLPAESRAKISATWMGRKHSPEALIRIGNASRGRKKSEASKQIMRDKMKGREITWGATISKAISKLTDEQVMEIKKQMAAKVSQYEIARRFNVHQGTISNIKRGKCYAHVILPG